MANYVRCFHIQFMDLQSIPNIHQRTIKCILNNYLGDKIYHNVLFEKSKNKTILYYPLKQQACVGYYV